MSPRDFDLQDRLVDFSVSICLLSRRLAGNRASPHIAHQMVRSGTSPAPNYAEACAAESRRDFIHKMHICLKELKETDTWLKLVERLDWVDEQSVDRLIQECDELNAIFFSSISTASSHTKRH